MSDLEFLSEALGDALFAAPINGEQPVAPAPPPARLYDIGGNALSPPTPVAPPALNGLDLDLEGAMAPDPFEADGEAPPPLDLGEEDMLGAEAALDPTLETGLEDAGYFEDGDLPDPSTAIAPTAREAVALRDAISGLEVAMHPMGVDELNAHLSRGGHSSVTDPYGDRLRLTIRAMMRRQA